MLSRSEEVIVFQPAKNSLKSSAEECVFVHTAMYFESRFNKNSLLHCCFLKSFCRLGSTSWSRNLHSHKNQPKPRTVGTRRFDDVLPTFWRRFADVLMTFWRRVPAGRQTESFLLLLFIHQRLTRIHAIFLFFRNMQCVLMQTHPRQDKSTVEIL